MKALIVDGEELFRLSMREVVHVAAAFAQVIEAISESDFLSKTAQHDTMDLVILHPSTLKHTHSNSENDEGMNCLKLARRLYPNAPVIVVTDSVQVPPDRWPHSTIVNRLSSVTQMVGKIRAALRLPNDNVVSSIEYPSSPDVRGALLSDAEEHAPGGSFLDMARLSFRQKQILTMAADGLPNKEIAARLTIAEGTVKAHMHAIFKVLNVSNRTQAVIKFGSMARTPRPLGHTPQQPSPV
jgi:DNA-binding NarL/FixJ family response regulator